MDLETGEIEPRRIVDAFRRTAYRLRVLTVRGPDGRELPAIRTTDEHSLQRHDPQSRGRCSVSGVVAVLGGSACPS
ncbi:MAG: hypothetical protein NTW96_03625 [Planctomycetia bacterium]|nr:hypothetical protein [Planctomycetia bacterium]